jgi:transcription elongation factor GreB
VSRAFVKEDADAEPVVVPPRAPLPDGVPNWVTAAGLRALEQELGQLETDLERLRSRSDARAVASAAGRLEELRVRLASAEVVAAPPSGSDEVRFGAQVTLRRQDGRMVRLHIVGVDEAEPSMGKVAFTAPVAAAALGRRLGDAFSVPIGEESVRFEVVGVTA